MSYAGVLARSIGLGAACGLRSMAGPAALAFSRGQNECAGCQPALLRQLRSDRGRLAVAAAATAEVILDKTSLLPNRIEPRPLVGRILLGGLSGLLLALLTDRERPVPLEVAGAIAGGVGATAGTFAGYHARRHATQSWRLPDLLVASVEDGQAYAIAWLAAR